ncbi:hypothetical protein KY284_007925 [Solanum tuberosum]|nr:hypothetical protein KY284_007925 [Solanum tuberosum]
MENLQQINGTIAKEAVKDDGKDEKADEPWVNMFKKNKNAGNGMALEYITPQFVEGEIVVQLEKEDVEREIEKWNCALIIYAIGECQVSISGECPGNPDGWTLFYKLPSTDFEEMGQARRSGGHAGQKKVVQKWISKGPIIQAAQTTQQQGEGIVIQPMEVERIVHGQNKNEEKHNQTQLRGKSQEFTPEDFPMLYSLPIKNIFIKVRVGGGSTKPPDKGTITQSI